MRPQPPIGHIITINIIRLVSWSWCAMSISVHEHTRTSGTQRISWSKASIQSCKRPRRRILDDVLPTETLMMLHHQRGIFIMIEPAGNRVVQIQIEKIGRGRVDVWIRTGLHPRRRCLHLRKLLRTSWRYRPLCRSQLDLDRSWRLDAAWRFLVGHCWSFVAAKFGPSVLKPYLKHEEEKTCPSDWHSCIFPQSCISCWTMKALCIMYLMISLSTLGHVLARVLNAIHVCGICELCGSQIDHIGLKPYLILPILYA